MQLFRSLTHRPFALLWSGQTISRIGDNLYGIALAWWILEKTGSARAQSTVLIFSTVPMLIFLLIGGVAVDRVSRARVMIASDVLRGLLLAALTLLIVLDRLEVWHIALAAMVFGFVSAFFRPAYVALVPELTPSEIRPSANSLTSLSGQLIGIVGPSLGALMVALGGSALAFGLDSVSFFVAALLLLPLLKLSQAHTIGQKKNFAADLRTGVRTVVTAPWLWITIAMFGVINLMQASPFFVAMPFLIRDTQHADVGALGLVYSALSLGSVVGAVWLGRYSKLHRRGLIGYGAVIVGALAIMLLGLPIGLYAMLAAVFVRGICLSVFGLIWVHSLQEIVPSDQLGRVSSIDDLGSFVLLPLGYAVSGWATDLLGPQTVFLVGGAVTALVAALALLHPAIRRFD